MSTPAHTHPMTPETAPRPHEDLIDSYLDHLQLLRRSPATIETYGGILRHAHRELPYGLASATETELEAWVGSAATAATQRMRTLAITGFFAWAVGKGHLDFDPASGLPMPKLPHKIANPATDEQVLTILDRAPTEVRRWSIIAAYAGARAIEVGRLHREHITARGVRLFGKGSKERLVPAHDLVLEVVDGLPPGPITDRTACQLRHHARYTYHKLGVPIGIHRLRAWFGTTMLQAGHDLATVQDLMGHASPETTRRYAGPSSRQLQAAVAALPTVAPRFAADDAPALEAAASGPM